MFVHVQKAKSRVNDRKLEIIYLENFLFMGRKRILMLLGVSFRLFKNEGDKLFQHAVLVKCLTFL